MPARHAAIDLAEILVVRAHHTHDKCLPMITLHVAVPAEVACLKVSGRVCCRHSCLPFLEQALDVRLIKELC